jgi:hypothetical protein
MNGESSMREERKSLITLVTEDFRWFIYEQVRLNMALEI